MFAGDRRLAGHLQTLLAAMVADAERPVDSLPLLPAEERRQLLVDASPGTGWPRDTCLHELVGAQAARTPAAPALAAKGRTVTYGELDRRANQLAHYLRRRGVRPDARVALCVERSAAFIVGLLGILKAGGAYVPIEPGREAVVEL